jgi:outer membrane protein TolC
LATPITACKPSLDRVPPKAYASNVRSVHRGVLLATALAIGTPLHGSAHAAPAEPPSPREATPAPKGPPDAPPTRTTAFEAKARAIDDPYGARPEGVAQLSLDQIVRYALDNPAVLAAEEDVVEMRTQLRKAKFAWIPIVSTSATLSPGANVQCDDLRIDDNTPDGFDFQFCRPPNRVDIQSVKGYFSQLARAGVRVELKADILIPITTFGKFRNLKKLAEVGVALRQLQKLQVEHETVMRVHQAHATLLAAREAITILREARGIVDKAQDRIEADLGGGAEDWDAEPTDANPDRDPDDLFKVRLARLDVEELMRQALKVESLALSALWALAGKAAPKGFDVEDRKLAPLPIAGELEPVAKYKELAARHRPEARMASAAVKARQFQEKLARANFLPDLGIAINLGIARSTAADMEMSELYYQDGFNFSRVTAALALRWQWDFHFKALDLQAARAASRAAAYREEAARLLLGRDVEEAYGDLVEARYDLVTYAEAMDLSWKLVVSGQQKDTVGGGNATELLRNLKQWYEKRFEHARAIQAHNEALARLSRAVGTQLVRTSSPLPDVRAGATSPGRTKAPKRRRSRP